jgi:large subunit ribosomal protein L13
LNLLRKNRLILNENYGIIVCNGIFRLYRKTPANTLMCLNSPAAERAARNSIFGGIKMTNTFMPKVESVERKWHILDADGKPLGRVAAEAAALLRGKHKPSFAPHCDCGDHVIIINCSKTVLTGNKLQKKFYRRHTGWIGHLKEVKYDKMMSERPDFAMTLAVKGMLPDTTIGRKALTRLRVYKGADHKNHAQKPELREVPRKV